MIKIDIGTTTLRADGVQITVVLITGESGEMLGVGGVGKYHVNTSKLVWDKALNGPQRQSGYPTSTIEDALNRALGYVRMVQQEDRWFLHVQENVLFEISTEGGLSAYDMCYIHDIKSKLEEFIQETLHGNLHW